MIVIPLVRPKRDSYWKLLAIALLVIIFLASSFVSVYWYLFGTRNPFVKKPVQQNQVYTPPNERLLEVMKQKIIESNAKKR